MKSFWKKHRYTIFALLIGTAISLPMSYNEGGSGFFSFLLAVSVIGLWTYATLAAMQLTANVVHPRTSRSRLVCWLSPLVLILLLAAVFTWF